MKFQGPTRQGSEVTAGNVMHAWTKANSNMPHHENLYRVVNHAELFPCMSCLSYIYLNNLLYDVTL